MTSWWLAVGPPEQWQIAFEHGSTWGLRASAKHTAIWESLSEGDGVLFYATLPVGGVIGYGTVSRKFRQTTPLWPSEVKEGKAIWPNRFEFDVKYLLPQDRWETHKTISDYLKAIVQSGFQLISSEIANRIVQTFPSDMRVPQEREKTRISLHDEIKAELVEIGRLQKHIAEPEYDMDGGKLDVVWRRIERAVPSSVFEIQIGGDLYHAIGKLKHAYDLWNSNIFLVVNEGDINKANELLSGTFHEIQKKIRLIEASKIDELLKRKKAYHDFESELGII